MTVLAEAMTAAAAAGAGAVVQAAGSDLWAWFRTRCARLIGRGDSRREEEALDQLDTTAADLNAADDGNRERVRGRHAHLWQEEFLSVLRSLEEQQRERFADELRALERQFGNASGSSGGVLSGNSFHGPTNVQTGDHSTQTNYFGTQG
ncbi:hypothetical protein [Streptomyces sp. NPDC059649]|uniref:hypothetical protein n=1 Tax=Streptomyces sp. NPDC059649 TaxID=3346895 RepID=UPI003678FA4C